MDIKSQLLKNIKQGILDKYQLDVSINNLTLEDTPKNFIGSYSFATFSLSKLLKKSPDEIATNIGEYLLTKTDIVSDYNVIKGFLNINLNHYKWIDAFAKHINKEGYYTYPTIDKRKILIEFCSPNTNKPLHLGHLRNICIGNSMAGLLKFVGQDVYKINQVNDRGIHISKSMVAYMLFGQGELPTDKNIKGDHFVGNYYVKFESEYKKELNELTQKLGDPQQAEKQSKLMHEARKILQRWEQNDHDVITLWKKMNQWVYNGFEDTYKELEISFDKTYYESETYLYGKKVVEEGLEKNIFYKKPDGSVWINLDDEGLGEKLVLRSDGTSVYITQDLGNADLRYNNYKFDDCIYVVGNEQDYHFKVLFSIIKKLGRPYADKLYHLSYGMVTLPMGKMKSREGNVVDADDLIKEMITTAKQKQKELTVDEKVPNDIIFKDIALGALKYFLLRVDSKKKILFNPNESIDFHGNTGTFIQYTYARINSILDKATHIELNEKINIDSITSLTNHEIELIKLVIQFNDKIIKAYKEYSLVTIAQYVLDISRNYNKFYAEINVLKANDNEIRNMRLLLSKHIAIIIKKCMDILGIKVVKKM